ncbi:MAG: GNAT family N-acetyltransferase [bacterium]
MSGPGHASSWRVERSCTFPGDWDDVVAADPLADYTHTRHWHEAALRNFPGAGLECLTVRRDGRLVGGIAALARPGASLLPGGLLAVRRLDSSLEGTSGGPVLHPDLEPAEADGLFARLAAALADRRPAGLGSVGLALNPEAEARFGKLLQDDPRWARRDSPTAMVSLAGGIDEVDGKRLVMNKRNERNRGLRRGAEVFATTDTRLVAEYYQLYRSAAAHWGSAPTPLGFLQDLLQGPGSPGGAGSVFFTCVRLDGRVIGGHLNLHLHDKVFAWNGVTDPAYARTHFPATLCFWGDLVEACRRGARWLDFGASGGVSSLASFKKFFGAELRDRGFYLCESAVVARLRGLRERRGRTRGRPGRRWHDEVPPPEKAGGR